MSSNLIVPCFSFQPASTCTPRLTLTTARALVNYIFSLLCIVVAKTPPKQIRTHCLNSPMSLKFDGWFDFQERSHGWRQTASIRFCDLLASCKIWRVKRLHLDIVEVTMHFSMHDAVWLRSNQHASVFNLATSFTGSLDLFDLCQRFSFL